ncbi:MAG: hypothetical protein WBY44_03615 [Bryobacteraceae bacterium]|jgi:hypothetical protein
MKELVRLLILCAGVFAALKGGRVVPTVLASGDCVRDIETEIDDVCADCCQFNSPVTVATFTDDPSFGPWSYTTMSQNCGTALSGCTSGQCGAQYYLSKYTDAGCCNGLGGGCATNADCCNGFTCYSNLCMNSNPDKSGCITNADCCSGNCQSGSCQSEF